MTDTEIYNVNFFAPLSSHAKANKKLILILASIWAVAVFGFQILLIVLNEPTPEPAYTAFQRVWPEVADNPDATMEQKQDFSRSLLSVLGKNNVVPEKNKAILREALSWSVYSMADPADAELLKSEPSDASFGLAARLIGLAPTGLDKIMTDLLPTSLVAVTSSNLSSETRKQLPGIMSLYLIHNENALTRFEFLGFPFHYWYTAQFLLILFVLLCLVYALATDRLNKKHDFVEAT